MSNLTLHSAAGEPGCGVEKHSCMARVPRLWRGSNYVPNPALPSMGPLDQVPSCTCFLNSDGGRKQSLPGHYKRFMGAELHKKPSINVRPFSHQAGRQRISDPNSSCLAYSLCLFLPLGTCHFLPGVFRFFVYLL